MIFVLSTLIEGGRATSVAIIGIAATIAAIGVIWKRSIRPALMTAKKAGDHWAWLEKQLAPENGEGSISRQLKDIAGTQKEMQERQNIGGEIIARIVDRQDRLEADVAVNTSAVAELKANLGELRALLGETVSYARQTKEVVTEVRHEQVVIAEALAIDTAVITGEHPVTP